MAARSRARYLAPIALVAAIVGTYVIVHNGLVTKHSPPAQAQTTTTTPHVRAKYARQRFYTVKSGDTLTQIASKTGVSLSALTSLNPSVNPNALQTGQRLRLRR